MKKLLVCANETVGGRALIEAVKRRAEQGPVSVLVVCPQNQPRHGYVIYDESVRHAAENRLRATLAHLEREGIQARGEVMDPDPFNAITDAAAEFQPDEIVISTHPATRSGWLRRDLIQRVELETGLPVEHVVVDLDADRREATRTLVVANRTVGGETLFDLLRRKAEEHPRHFIVICPQGGSGDGDPHARLAALLERLRDEGWEAIGQVMDPDPFTAIQNALQFYAVDEIVISTFPETRSGWLRGDLVERVRASTALPVEHVVSDAQAPAEAEPSEVTA
ncbi:MAG: universal stress protein [Thermoleophilaceae bacterium]|nr:universal stress protein [Thermoleophilaceae bacterium]